MSNIVQEILFPGSGLNQDDNYNFIDLGSSPYRLNIMVSGDGANAIITNALGNERTIDINDHLLLLSHTYVTIGSYYNRLTRKVYYWVWTQPYNSGDDSGAPVYIYDNRLLCYNEDTETLDLIFIDTKNYFGLDINYPMRDCTMLEDWLYFNPKVSEPKMIDVVRAYNYTNYDAYSAFSTYIYGDKVTFSGGLFMANTSILAGQTPSTHVSKWDRIGDSYRSDTEIAFDSEFDYAFNVIKMPPPIRPTLVYGNDTYIKANNVRGKIFRFAYRYKYFDNSYSVYSAFSDVALPEDDEIYNGEVINDISFKNYLKVTVYPHSPALVKELEVVFQQISGEWKRAKVVNRQQQSELDDFTVNFNFYNNESYIVVDDTVVATVSDAVPRMANSQEIINKNILAYGGCFEGFKNLDKDDIRVGLTPYLQSINVPPTVGTVRRNNITSGDISDISGYNADGFNVIGREIDMTWLMGTVVATDIYVVTIDGHTEYHTITVAEAADRQLLVNNLVAFLQSVYGIYDINNTAASLYIDIWSSYGTPVYADITQSIFGTNAGTGSSLTKKRGFKTGANHPFCIYYYDDNMRRWDAQVSKDNVHIFGYEMHGTTVYVPLLNEATATILTTAYRWLIDWEVYHLPPAGAKYWRWGYAANSLCNNMVQYIISSVANSSGTEGANMVKIDITPLQTLKSTSTATWNQYPTSIIDSYSWAKGDRVRFITKASNPGGGTNEGNLIDGVYEYEIIKQDTTDNTIFIQGTLASSGFITAGAGINSLVEIYSPLKSVADTKTVYYEFGEIMPIIEDSAGIMVHAGQDGIHNQDTALSSVASGTFDGGDIYHIIRTPSKPIDTTTPTKGFFHESMWYSDFYDSADYDRGKIGFETSFGERFLNIVRYSFPFFQNTQINGLPTFDGANYKELNDVFGNIVAIYEIGDTLKVYQERKASSILIGRTEYMDSTGATQVAISTAVLGAIRYSPSNYSTVFPESIARNNKYLYGFDIYNGVAWRDGVNGIFPISGRYAEAGGDADYKMQTYFKLKSKALLASGLVNIDVLGVWDEEYKLLYITFKDYVTEANNETIVFHEPSNRWITFASFDQTPEGGYNMPLELTYTIVKGFEGGLGFSFNEDTRFAEFNIGGGLGTPDNFTPLMDLAALTITAYDPTVTVDCDTTADVASVVITPYDPTTTVTLAPAVDLKYIESIPDGIPLAHMYIWIHYDNPGDAITQSVDWRVKDSGGNVVNSGTIASVIFGGQVVDASVLNTSLRYEDPDGDYTLEVKLGTEAWVNAISVNFTSLLI